jgi:hypothetical protein
MAKSQRERQVLETNLRFDSFHARALRIASLSVREQEQYSTTKNVHHIVNGSHRAERK